MPRNVVARIIWNRLDKTIEYKSINEYPQIDAVYQKKGKLFVLVDCKINDTGYYPGDVNNKLRQIQKYLQRNYSQRIQ
jgi:hypothetical protein